MCEVVCKKAGIELVVAPISSTELNRSKVGETEKLLLSLFQRGEKLPHLLCCIAIDEVDALAPKRNDKTGEYKVDILCLLLSLIGGIKDIPNIFVIASTNRLNKMDEAFCRRLQTKFFVGRLAPKKRTEIVAKIRTIEIEKQSLEFSKNLEEYTQQVTINFSGAAMESFRSRIVSHMYSHNLRNITREILNNIANQVAIDFQILLGTYSIPLLISSSANVREMNLDSKFNFTGRIFVDLSDEKKCSIQLEYKDKDSKKHINEHFYQKLNYPEPTPSNKFTHLRNSIS